jgi:hypothetical protein
VYEIESREDAVDLGLAQCLRRGHKVETRPDAVGVGRTCTAVDALREHTLLLGSIRSGGVRGALNS